MNPVDIQDEIRNLEIILSGGSPVRPAADYGKGEVGHFDGVKARNPSVEPIPATDSVRPEVIWESYVIAETGEMTVQQPRARSGLDE